MRSGKEDCRDDMDDIKNCYDLLLPSEGDKSATPQVGQSMARDARNAEVGRYRS